MRAITVGRDAKGRLSDQSFASRSRQRVSCTTPSRTCQMGRIPRRGSAVGHQASRSPSGERSTTPSIGGFNFTLLERGACGQTPGLTSEGACGAYFRFQRKSRQSLYGDERLKSDGEHDVCKRAHATLDLVWRKFGEAQVFVRHNCIEEALLTLDDAKHLIDTMKVVNQCCSAVRLQQALEQLGKELSAVSHSCILYEHRARRTDSVTNWLPCHSENKPSTAGCVSDEVEKNSSKSFGDTTEGGCTGTTNAGSAEPFILSCKDSPCVRRQHPLFTKLNNYMEGCSEGLKECVWTQGANPRSAYPVSPSARSETKLGCSAGNVKNCGNTSVDISCGPPVVPAHFPFTTKHPPTVVPTAPMATSGSWSGSDERCCCSCILPKPKAIPWRSRSSCYPRGQGQNEWQQQDEGPVCSPPCSGARSQVDNMFFPSSRGLDGRTKDARLKPPVHDQGNDDAVATGYCASQNVNYRASSRNWGGSSPRDGLDSPSSVLIQRPRGVGVSEKASCGSCSQGLSMKASPLLPLSRRRASLPHYPNKGVRRAVGTNLEALRPAKFSGSTRGVGVSNLLKLCSFGGKTPQRRTEILKKPQRLRGSAACDSQRSMQSSVSFSDSARSYSRMVALNRIHSVLAYSPRQHRRGLGWRANRGSVGMRTRNNPPATPGLTHSVCADSSLRRSRVGASTSVPAGSSRKRMSRRYRQAERCAVSESLVSDYNVPFSHLGDDNRGSESIFSRYFAGIRNYQQARVLHKRVVEQLLLEHEVEEMERDMWGGEGECGVNRKEVLLRHLEDAYNSWLISHLGAKQKVSGQEEIRGDQQTTADAGTGDVCVEERQMVHPSSPESTERTGLVESLVSKSPTAQIAVRTNCNARDQIQFCGRNSETSLAIMQPHPPNCKRVSASEEVGARLLESEEGAVPPNKRLEDSNRREQKCWRAAAPVLEGVFFDASGAAKRNKSESGANTCFVAGIAGGSLQGSNVRGTAKTVDETRKVGCDKQDSGARDCAAVTQAADSQCTANISSFDTPSNTSVEQKISVEEVTGITWEACAMGPRATSTKVERDVAVDPAGAQSLHLEAVSEPCDDEERRASDKKGARTDGAETKAMSSESDDSSEPGHDLGSDAVSGRAVELEAVPTGEKNVVFGFTAEMNEYSRLDGCSEWELVATGTVADSSSVGLEGAGEVDDEMKSKIAAFSKATAEDISVETAGIGALDGDCELDSDMEQDVHVDDAVADVDKVGFVNTSDDKRSLSRTAREPATTNAETRSQVMESDSASEVTSDLRSKSSINKDLRSGGSDTDLEDTKSTDTSEVFDDATSVAVGSEAGGASGRLETGTHGEEMSDLSEIGADATSVTSTTKEETTVHSDTGSQTTRSDTDIVATDHSKSESSVADDPQIEDLMSDTQGSKTDGVSGDDDDLSSSSSVEQVSRTDDADTDAHEAESESGSW